MVPTLLLTRPRDSAEDFASAAAWTGRVVISPILELRWRAIDPPAPDAGLVFTSQHGVRALARVTAWRDWPVWCVGPATLAAALAAGFAAPRPGGGTAQTLIARLLAAPPGIPLVHVHGGHVVTDLVGQLSAAGQSARGVVAYDQVACPLSDAARQCLSAEGAVVLPVFSPRSARLLVAEWGRLNAPRAGMYAVAISDAVAQVLGSLPLRAMQIAPTPDQPGMLAALARVQAMLEPD
ncbi:MAG: uroporphyrinogen-III synthase [Alphaproteobacteria bacterium]|jgi:uroporphyrinogen-III synthase|nr:uroporphyrinogen-III synthase [Alphaproteobacteria bacterium]